MSIGKKEAKSPDTDDVIKNYFDAIVIIILFSFLLRISFFFFFLYVRNLNRYSSIRILYDFKTRVLFCVGQTTPPNVLWPLTSSN